MAMKKTGAQEVRNAREEEILGETEVNKNSDINCYSANLIESATSAHEAEENCISFSKALRPKSFCKKNLEAP